MADECLGSTLYRRFFEEPPPAVRDLLAAHAATRERTADEHMFTVRSWNGARLGTFRLQLFTAPGTRPVAVATQGPAEGGRLADGAEDYAAEVWRRHFPGSPEPPVWITLQLRPGPQDETPEQFTLATFRTGDGHELFSPQTCQVTDADVAALTGMTVIRQARREGTAGWALSSRVAELLVGWLIRRRPCYGNGRHRITAMFDSGVRRTAVLRWRYPG